jgi:hypothetical protein
MSTAYKPSTDGQTENMNKQLQGALRCYVNVLRDDWAEHLPAVCWAINNSVSTTTRVTPFYYQYGRQPRTVASSAMAQPAVAESAFAPHLSKLLTDIWKGAAIMAEKAKEAQKTYVDEHRTDWSYDVGDLVALNCAYRAPLRQLPKLDKHWDGPYRVKTRVGSVAYELELDEGDRMHPVVWVGYLKPYLGIKDPTPAPLFDDQNQRVYEVETILKHARRARHMYYQVQWRGYVKPTWVSEPNLSEGAAKLLSEYQLRHPSVAF